VLPKLPRLTSKEAERILLKSGFQYIRSRGSHRIYQRDKERFVLPFHKGKTLHPKIVKALYEFIEDKIG
jgi:predicted RNA binding protein YcfA (HicA-like mRNA interferase family)